jgi:hypothetical protein
MIILKWSSEKGGCVDVKLIKLVHYNFTNSSLQWRRHVFITEKEMVAVWAVVASLANTGVLRTRHFIDNITGSCAGPLGVILQRDQQILNEVRYECQRCLGMQRISRE